MGMFTMRTETFLNNPSEISNCQEVNKHRGQNAFRRETVLNVTFKKKTKGCN